MLDRTKPAMPRTSSIRRSAIRCRRGRLPAAFTGRAPVFLVRLLVAALAGAGDVGLGFVDQLGELARAVHRQDAAEDRKHAEHIAAVSAAPPVQGKRVLTGGGRLWLVG